MLVMVRVFTPQELTNATNQDVLLFPGELVVKPAHYSLYSWNKLCLVLLCCLSLLDFICNHKGVGL